MLNIKSYFSPFFLARLYLTKDIEYVLSQYNIKGTVLDVGCGSKPYQSLFARNSHISHYYGIDFHSFSINKDFPLRKPDYYFQKKYNLSHELPFKNSQFNNTVSFQVLEHHQNPSKLISEMVRVTKKGGYIMMSFPFIWTLHEEPNDYFRFTHYAISNWLRQNNCQVVEIKKEGSVFSTISMLLNEEIGLLASKKGLFYILAFLLYIPFFLYQLLSFVLDKIYISPIFFSNYLILARKI